MIALAKLTFFLVQPVFDNREDQIEKIINFYHPQQLIK